ncbi:MAG: methionyl-tRNA formyltransferase [Thermodesulfobacteriales bacterium]|jgi:methionyl-tRNA formyltransferase|nr:MAG: methionyl-tRNA formyltransferase [Thermodesulfobacteriales bacterium]
MKIIFMGTPEFAVSSLKALIESDHDVVAVVAQPDKPKGRGRKLAPPPTKALAEQHNIPVLQPEKVRTQEFLSQLQNLSPDLICVTAYGKILPKSILEVPPYGCINVHASLLPKYRGAAPINWVIVRGETQSGITTMLMDEGMDTGDMLLKKEIQIQDEDDAGSLSEKLSQLGAELLLETISQLQEGKLGPAKQDESLATYAPMLKKSDGEIKWENPASELWNLIRGMNPWPGTFTTLGNKSLKIFKATLIDGEGSPGEVLESDPGVLRVSTGEGALEILELQLEGGKRLDTKSFLAGRKIEKGTILGN